MTEKVMTRTQQRRREDIVQAALRVFDRDGFEGARIDDVAAEADVAKGTVYLYFKNKQALLEGVIHGVVKPAVDAVEEVAEHTDISAADRLRQQIRTIGNRLAQGQMTVILRLMIAEGPKHGELRRFYYREIVNPGMRAIARCLADGEASGEFRPGTAKLHPQVFAGTAIMAAVWRMLFDDLQSIDIEALLGDHLDTVLHGIRS